MLLIPHAASWASCVSEASDSWSERQDRRNGIPLVFVRKHKNLQMISVNLASYPTNIKEDNIKSTSGFKRRIILTTIIPEGINLICSSDEFSKADLLNIIVNTNWVIKQEEVPFYRYRCPDFIYKKPHSWGLPNIFVLLYQALNWCYFSSKMIISLNNNLPLDFLIFLANLLSTHSVVTAWEQ